MLQVYKDYYPVLGGIELHVRRLCTHLVQRGVQVEALVTNTGRKTVALEMEGVPVTKAARLITLASTPVSLSLFQEMARKEVDIVHLHFPYPIGELAFLFRGRSRALVITYHSDIVRQWYLLPFYAPFLRRVLQQAERIIVGSEAYLRSSPWLRSHQRRCVVVPFGIELEPFQRPEPQGIAQVRQRHRPPILLFVGRFRYYKGLHYLVEAMKEVDGTLLLVGAGPEESRLRHQVRKAGLEHRILFLGEVPLKELVPLYYASDLFVLPACERSEAFGVAQLEAMACGLPVVSTELGTGTSFVNLHGVTGLVVPPRNPQALAQGINLLLQDEEQRLEMGRKAEERVEQEFGVEKMVERTLQVYAEALA